MGKKLILILILFIESTSFCFSQSTGRFDAVAKTQAIFMYGFTKYFVWAEDQKEGDFRIGVYGASDNLFAELKKLASLKKVGNQTIDIINLDLYSDLKKMPPLQMLYVNVAVQTNFKIKDVLKGTLVITDNEKDFKNYAIGFRFVQDKLKFGYNADNVERFGIEVKEGFDKLAYENFTNKSDKKIEEKIDEKKIIEQNANIGRSSNVSAAISSVGSSTNSTEYGPSVFDAEAKSRAIFIYGFTKYFEWSEDTKSNDFKIGIIGTNPSLKRELQKLASIKKIEGKKIVIVDLDINSDLNNLPSTQILYYNANVFKKLDLRKIQKNTLLISDNEKNYNNAVISFFSIEKKLKFVYNDFLAKQFGLITHESFKALAAINYEPTINEKLEWSDKVTDKKAEEVNSKANEVKTTSLNNTTLDKSVNASTKTNITLSKSKIISANTEWEDVLEKIKSNLDEVVLSKNEVQQISGKLIKQEKDIEEQQLKIDFQMETMEIQKDLMTQQEKNIKEKEVKLMHQENELILKSDKINRQQTIIWLSLAAILSVVFGLYMLFQNYSKSKKTNAVLEKQKTEIEFQKFVIEEKQHEILDSINYAQRIQRALLASKYLLDNNLHDYFVFFKPKDVVSGDFYWASTSQWLVEQASVEASQWLDERGNAAGSVFYLCTADSTGHGVPGSIMSMLNISCLEKAVEVEKLSQPKDILNHTRSKIIEALKRDGSETGGKDGMDCSLIALDFKNLKMVYAAAYNPVWIIRNIETIECIELEPDKMPVGKHDKDTILFTQHEVELKKGDVIYTFTDGLPDQFGGPKGKKFMYKKLKELLISISHLSMQQQQLSIENALTDWMGENEQVDDITIIGIRV